MATPKIYPSKRKMVKLIIDLGYVVPADDQTLIEEAKGCFYEDLMNFYKYNELADVIQIVDAPNNTEKDIPEFLLPEEAHV